MFNVQRIHWNFSIKRTYCAFEIQINGCNRCAINKYDRMTRFKSSLMMRIVYASEIILFFFLVRAFFPSSLVRIHDSNFDFFCLLTRLTRKTFRFCSYHFWPLTSWNGVFFLSYSFSTSFVFSSVFQSLSTVCVLLSKQKQAKYTDTDW